MIARRMMFAALVLQFVAAESAFAKTLFVDNSCSRNGDGTAKSCASSDGGTGAWNSLTEAGKSSNCGRISPGDIVEIAGGTYRNGTFKPEANCSGTASQRVIYQNAAGEDVTLDGTADISGSSWTSRGGGVYQCTGGTCGTDSKFPFTAWYDLGDGAGERQLRMTQTKTNCDSSLSVGEMRYDKNAGRVCVRLVGGANPTNTRYLRIPRTFAGIALQSTGVDYLTFRRNPAGGSFRIVRFRDHGVTSQTVNLGITLEGLEIGWVMDRCVNQSEGGGALAGYRIVDNEIHHCGQEGIRWSQDRSSAGLVADNRVHHIQSTDFYERCDNNCLPGFSDNGTAIRIVGQVGGRLSGNIIHDVGGGKKGRANGVNIENGSTNLTIENNYIYNMKLGGTAPVHGAAILFSTNSNQAYDGVVVRNNRIHNVDTCFSFDASPSATISGGNLMFNNNTCSEPEDRGLHKQDGNWNSRIEFINNIFTASSNSPSRLIDVSGSGSGGFVKPTFGVYHCPTCGNAGGMISWRGVNYGRAGSCNAGSSCVPNLDSRSRYGDPGLDLSGAVPTLALVLPSGPAYDLGTAVPGSASDFEGDTRPQGLSWDIGADEHAGTTAGAPQLLSVTPLP